MNRIYDIKEAAEITGIKPRMVRVYAENMRDETKAIKKGSGWILTEAGLAVIRARRKPGPVPSNTTQKCSKKYLKKNRKSLDK